MKRNNITVLAGLLLVGLSACKWNEDFRDRQQPFYLQQQQYIQPLPEPTLNPESTEYAGDQIQEDTKAQKSKRVRAIDELSTIPEVPEHPAGIELR